MSSALDGGGGGEWQAQTTLYATLSVKNEDAQCPSTTEVAVELNNETNGIRSKAD